MARAGDYKIPFDAADGGLLNYAGAWMKIVWEPNHEFDDTLTFIQFHRGRSAAYAEFRRADGRTIFVFTSDLETMIPRMVNGTITGRFTFIKRGANYGCRAL